MELTAALRFTGADFKPMVGVKPLSLEKEDGEVRKAFAAWLCIGKVLEAGLDGHRKGTVKGFDGGGLGGLIRVCGQVREMRPRSEQVLSEQTPSHLETGHKQGCMGLVPKPKGVEAAPCSRAGSGW